MFQKKRVLPITKARLASDVTACPSVDSNVRSQGGGGEIERLPLARIAPISLPARYDPKRPITNGCYRVS